MVQQKISELFETQIEQLDVSLMEAKLKLAESELRSSDWTGRSDNRATCKAIQAQIDILQTMDAHINDIFELAIKQPVTA